jgi:hypothetical protein
VISRAVQLALFMVVGCHRTPSDAGTARCAFCGMRIPSDSHWAAGAVGQAGQPLAFDAPGCLFRYRASSAGAGLRGGWVTEYYGSAGTHTPIDAVEFMVGSDVVGPMGPDLIPVDPSRADGFRRDHHPRATYRADDITATVLSSLQ